MYLGPAQAASVKPVVGFGVTVGGDQVYSFTNDCSSTSSFDEFLNSLLPCREHKSLNLGEGLYVFAGLVVPLAQVIESQLTIAYHYGSEYADNGSGSVDIRRYPVEALLFFKPNNWRIGIGVSHHLWPLARCDISSPTASCNFEIKYFDATGYVMQTDWDLAHMFNAEASYTFSVGLRYTSIEYHDRKLTGIVASGIEDASSIGLYTLLGF